MTAKFSNADLRTAALKVQNALLQAVPEEPDPQKFTAEFYDKMNTLLDRISQRKLTHRWIRAVITAVLAITATLTTWLSIDTHARNAFFEWIRILFNGNPTYTFIGQYDDMKLPLYELTWVPDGFELVETVERDLSMSSFYRNPSTGELLSFDYFFPDQGIAVTYGTARTDYVSEWCTVNGCRAEFIYANETSHLNNLIWIDDELRIVFQVDSTLDKDIMLKIADGIKLIEKIN